MIPEFDNPTETSARLIQTALGRGKQFRTPLEQRPDREVSAAGPVYLRPGDERCSICDDPIGEFGGAPYVFVLARMKRDGPTGETACADCHQPNRVATGGGEVQ